MLNIYPVILSFVADVAELTTRIGHHDPDLARQLRRSSTSVVLRGLLKTRIDPSDPG